MMFNSFFKTVRFSEWGSTKLFECIAVLFIGCEGQSGCIDTLNLVASVAFVSSYLALAYFINDISDLSADKKVGKDRGIHHLTIQGIFFVGFVLVSANIISLLVMKSYHTSLFIAGCVLSYLAMLGYSLPPFRLKEMGIAGVITAAIGQRTLPAIVLISTMKDIHHIVLLYLALLTINGLRWISIHQVLDLENDKKAGISTYAVLKSEKRLRSIMFYFLLPSEFALGIALTICLINTSFFLPLVLYWLGLPFFTLLWIRKYGPIDLFSYNYVPGGNFLLFVFPMVMLIRFSLSNPVGWIVLAMAIVIKYKYLCWQSTNVVSLVGLVWNRCLAKR